MIYDLCDRNLDSEYREALAHSLIELKYLSDSPLKLSMGTDKQQEELKEVYEKPLKSKQIKEIVSFMSNEMKGDFQYGNFTSFISKYINIANEMEKIKNIRILKQYKNEKINTILNNLEFNMKKDEDYDYRDIDYDLNELYKNIDKLLEYVSNDFQGKLYLNSNIWNICYEALTEILSLYNLKFVIKDKVTEQHEVVNANEYHIDNSNELTIKLIGIDEHYRPVYEDKKGNLYKDVNLGERDREVNLFISYRNDFSGEPYIPLNEDIKINIVKSFKKDKEAER